MGRKWEEENILEHASIQLNMPLRAREERPSRLARHLASGLYLFYTLKHSSSESGSLLPWHSEKEWAEGKFQALWEGAERPSSISYPAFPGSSKQGQRRRTWILFSTSCKFSLDKIIGLLAGGGDRCLSPTPFRDGGTTSATVQKPWPFSTSPYF